MEFYRKMGRKMKKLQKNCAVCKEKGGKKEFPLVSSGCTEQELSVREDPCRIVCDRKVRQAHFFMHQDHSHEFYELYYLVSGGCRVFLNHTIYHLDAGGIVLIEPGALHHTIYEMTQESERIAVCFDRKYMEQFESACGSGWREKFAKNPYLRVEGRSRAFLEELFRKLTLEKEHRDGFSDLLRRQGILEILASLARESQEDRQIRIEEVPEKAIQTAAQYICAHFREQITLEMVAGQVFLSPSYFSRQFKKLTGFGYKEYLNHVRLKEASRLLRESDDSISEIARLCGFTDGNYFGDLFHKIIGVSPREYRKQYRAQSPLHPDTDLRHDIRQ